MTYTTLEQSKALVHLGLDEKTADMYYQQTEDAVDCWEVHIGKMDAQNEFPQIPCWSAEALLDILPKHTCTEDGKDYSLVIEKTDNDIAYFIGYHDVEMLNYEYVIEETGELITVLCEIIKWLLTNKL